MNPIIEKKIKELNPINQDDYKNALKEILQNIVLVTLAENAFLN